MNITAVTTRSDGWWAIEVPEIKGLHTQARRLDQVREMVTDAASLLTGEPEDSFNVTLSVNLDAETGARLEHAMKLAKVAAEAQAEASEINRELAADLVGRGLTLRDVGSVLHVSHQRAAQLVGSARAQRRP